MWKESMPFLRNTNPNNNSLAFFIVSTIPIWQAMIFTEQKK